MKQDNNEYEFRAMTISKLILAMTIWIFIFFCITPPIEQMFNYDTIKKPSVFDNVKIYGLILTISLIFILIINQFIISSKYNIKFIEDTIIIFKNKVTQYQIPLENINFIELKISSKPVGGFIQISHNNKSKLRLFNGFIFTFFKEKKILEELIVNKIKPFLEKKEYFKMKIKQDNNNISYFFTKK
ncbi:MAG: hypothetical protein ACK5MD_09115 [Flavobacteriales bacterium]